MDYNALAAQSFQSPALQKKTKGFIDFDLQMFRPEISMSNAHEKRFDPYNYFPNNLSNNKPVRQIDFDKNIPRDNKIYDTAKCSDSLFQHHHLDLVRKKKQGILQFQNIGSKRGDEERRMAKLKEFKNPQDNFLDDLLGKNLELEDKKRCGDALNPYANLMRGVDYRNTSLHYNRGISIEH